MQIKARDILQQQVEVGLSYAINRIFKHAIDPHFSQRELEERHEEMARYIMDAIDEVFLITNNEELLGVPPITDW